MDLSPISALLVAFNRLPNYMIQAIERLGVKGVLMGIADSTSPSWNQKQDQTPCQTAQSGEMKESK